MTDAEIVADLFGFPCDYSPIDEEMCEMDHEWCEECAKRTKADCWQRYFDLKRRKEDKL